MHTMGHRRLLRGDAPAAHPQTHTCPTNAHRPLHQVVSAGDFRGVGAAPVPHVVPVSLRREEGGQRLAAGPAPGAPSVRPLGPERRRVNAAPKKGSNCGCASSSSLRCGPLPRRRPGGLGLRFKEELIVTETSAEVPERKGFPPVPALQERGSSKAKLFQPPSSLLTTWIFRSMERRTW